MSGTVGKLTWVPPTAPAPHYGRSPLPGDSLWALDVKPHVAIRAKRMFPRIRTEHTKTLRIVDTDEVAFDLQWFTQRYPLEMSTETRRQLDLSSARYSNKVQAIDNLLHGDGLPMPDLALGVPSMEPRQYQEDFIKFFQQSPRMILGDDVGLGKTISAGLGLALPDALPALIVVPTHMPTHWERKLALLWPDLVTHTVKGTRPYDMSTVKKLKGRTPHILIVPYSRIAGWAPTLVDQVNTVIFDEVQDLRTGTRTDKGRAARMIADKATRVLGLSATPAYNYGTEHHAIYDILAPGNLGSREEFLREWCTGGFGQQPMLADPGAFGEHLRETGLMLARTRKDVHMQMPEPIRIVETVDTDPAALDNVAGDVAALAKMILDDTLPSREKFHLGGQIDWKLRQATGVAKAPYVAEYVRLLLESEDKVVLFGWHREVYEIWNDRLSDFKPAMYTGSESPNQKNNSIDRFLLPNSDPNAARVLIISLRSGAGLDGIQDVASAAVFGELDWSPWVHHQGLGRLDRTGQTSTVLEIYLVAEDGSDPAVREVLNLKDQDTKPVMDPSMPTTVQLDPTVATSRMRLLAEAALSRAANTKTVPNSPPSV